MPLLAVLALTLALSVFLEAADAEAIGGRNPMLLLTPAPPAREKEACDMVEAEEGKGSLAAAPCPSAALNTAVTLERTRPPYVAQFSM